MSFQAHISSTVKVIPRRHNSQQFLLQKHSEEQFNRFVLQIHLLQHSGSDLHPHLISSLQLLAASGSVDQRGFQTLSLDFTQPKFSGDGAFWMDCKLVDQKLAWYKLLFVCCRMAAQVGGNFCISFTCLP